MTSPRTLALLLLALAWPLPSGAAADPAALAAATARVGAAGTALDAAQAAPGQIAPLARAIADYDAALAALRAEVQAATDRQQLLADDFEAHRVEIARLLAAMEAVSAAPTRALHPQGPLAAAQAAAMMQRLAPAMRAQATGLSEQVAAMRAARAEEADGTAALAAGLARLAPAQAALEAAMAAAEPAAGAQDPALATLARESLTLTQLAQGLAASPGPLPAPAGSADKLAWPAAGEIVGHFEEPDAARVRRPGLVLAVQPLAMVTAPADAVVRYAGPFLEYGYVVVLEPDAETMLVLAGISRLQVATGAMVKRGDLLGLMGGRSPDVEEYVMTPAAGDGAEAGERLYIEVRRGKGPVDPEPLFVGQNG